MDVVVVSITLRDQSLLLSKCLSLRAAKCFGPAGRPLPSPPLAAPALSRGVFVVIGGYSPCSWWNSYDNDNYNNFVCSGYYKLLQNWCFVYVTFNYKSFVLWYFGWVLRSLGFTWLVSRNPIGEQACVPFQGGERRLVPRAVQEYYFVMFRWLRTFKFGSSSFKFDYSGFF